MLNLKILPALLLVLALIAACGGGDDKDETPTPTASDGASPDGSSTEGPTPDVSGPAEAIAIFASSSAARQALAATGDVADIQLYLLSGSAIGDGAFANEEIPAGVELRGVRVTGVERETGFEDRYSAAFEYPDPEPAGFREAYDSVYLAALASLAAGSVEPAAIHDHLHLVANSPGDIIVAGPEGWTAATEALAAGADIDFTGASGLADLTADGDSSKSATEVWAVINNAYTPLETRDVDLAAEVGAENPLGEPGAGAEALDAPLIIGGIASLTGEQAAAGDAITNAMQLAVDEINAAGGILGQTVEIDFEDDGGTVASGVAAAGTLRDAGASVIIGPSDGSIAAAVVEQVTASAAIPTLVLSNWPGLGGVDDGGFMFSVVASERVEAPVLANLMQERDLNVACVLYEEGAAGEAMAAAFTEALEFKRGAVRNTVAFTTNTEDLGALLSDCVSS